MDIRDIDTRLSNDEKKKLDKMIDHIKTKGNFLDTPINEAALRKKLSILPSVCPCHICTIVRDRNKVESLSLPQVAMFKHESFSEDENKLIYVVSPFKHISNEEFLMSPIWSFTGRIIIAMKNILSHIGERIDTFSVIVDDKNSPNWVEHASIRVQYFRKPKGN